MLILLPLLPFLILLASLRDRQGGFRGAILIAAVLWATYLVGLTEILSLFNAVTVSGLVFGWIVGSLLAVIAAVFNLLPLDDAPIPAATNRAIPPLVAPIMVIASVLAFLAWLGPPNNFDSLVYHSPRVIHWIQNRNVAFYPTSNLRQLEMGPAAEYIVLHFQLLTGGDRFSDFVQWSAYCGCIVAVSAIAGLLGAGALGQLLAAVVVASLPMACLQAVTTQNDLVAAFWLSCLAWLFLRTLQLSQSPWGSSAWLMTFLCGAALGLALLTKSTAYIFAAPLVLGFFAALLIRRRFLPVALIALVAVTINMPAYARNMRFSHSPIGAGGFGPDGGAPYRNQRLGVGPTLTNGLTNAGLELALPQYGIAATTESAVRSLCHLLGLDPDDPATRFQGEQFRLNDLLWNSEDFAPSPLHLILLAAAALMLWMRPRQTGPTAALYLLALLLGYLGFCAALRWQPWNNRLLLPLLVLGSAGVGLAMERHLHRSLCVAIACVLLIAAVPFIVTDYNHPMIGPRSIFQRDRDARYFIGWRQLQPDYQAIVAEAVAHHCRQVGLIIHGREYPLMMLLRRQLPDVRIEHYPCPACPRHVWSAQELHTSNRGWDETLKPYLIANIQINSAAVVRVVDQ